MLKNIALANFCWKKRLKYREIEENHMLKVRVTTRNVKSLRIPVARGLNSLSVEVSCRKTWNLLPARIKEEHNKAKAVRMIKSWAAQR